MSVEIVARRRDAAMQHVAESNGGILLIVLRQDSRQNWRQDF
jgi:hypothetical protein